MQSSKEDVLVPVPEKVLADKKAAVAPKAKKEEAFPPTPYGKKLNEMAQSLAASLDEKFKTMKDGKKSSPADFLPLAKVFVNEVASMGLSEGKKKA